MMIVHAVSLLLLVFTPSAPLSAAFVVSKNVNSLTPTHAPPSLSNARFKTAPSRRRQHAPSSSSSDLEMANALAIAKNVVAPLMTPVARRLLLLLGAAFLVLSKQYKRILWPGSASDPSISEPVPPGSFGCPFFGSNILSGTQEYGPYAFFSRAAKKLGNPKLFKFYMFGLPSVSVSGKDNIKMALKNEFETDGINTMTMSDNFGEFFGNENILYEPDKAKHGMLRRLVGVAMSPSAINAAIPAIQAAANSQIDKMLKSDGTTKMEDICNDFTLDVAWKQILGLELAESEVGAFHEHVKDWINGFLNPLFLLPFPFPGMKRTKAWKARVYLVNKVEEKIQSLDTSGPDGSTLSAMYFARDEDDSSQRLTRKQVIDNALILILAGSETSASTLTVASLVLGLHRDVFVKVKEEQRWIRSKYDDDITKEQLDECKYLESVIKETLRIKPLDGMEFRKTEETLIIDGKQIPKNWLVYSNIRQTHLDDPVTFKEDGSHMDVKEGFNPDRWLNDATKPSVWLPFGEGGRRCLGERLAMTEMKIFLATLARRADFDLVRAPTDVVLWKKQSVMSRPFDGVEVKPRVATL